MAKVYKIYIPSIMIIKDFITGGRGSGMGKSNVNQPD